jgi:hypothetical protein
MEEYSPPDRLLPHRPLPPYSYVSGLFPHPKRDPRGHGFGIAEPLSVPPDETNWPTCENYLFAIDLCNHGYYWEAHEAWESLWHACGRRGVTADFLKGLIKLAAAGVKAREGNPRGIARHSARAIQLFASVREAQSPQADFLGLSLAQLIEHAGQVGPAAARLVNRAAEPVVIVLPFRLAVRR